MKCAICGKSFTPNPRAHGQKYCGRNCYNIANRKSKHSRANIHKLGVADKPIRQVPVNEDTFETLPQAPMYEMNAQGILRNKITKRILTWQRHPGHAACTQIRIAPKERATVTLPNLLWQLHGTISHKVMRNVPCSIEKGTRYLKFDTLQECALFLVTVTKYKFGGVHARLAHRKEQVGDWKIHYFNWG